MTQAARILGRTKSRSLGKNPDIYGREPGGPLITDTTSLALLLGSRDCAGLVGTRSASYASGTSYQKFQVTQWRKICLTILLLSTVMMNGKPVTRVNSAAEASIAARAQVRNAD